ncbi:MAG TPA: DMT family transporter [Gemmatimonadaceae bacterium]|nr:DMT family transporter [Gemmatimonadaceae bacterium]
MTPASLASRAKRVPPGLRYMAYGAFWFSIMSLLVKVAGQRLASTEIVLVRAVVTLVLSILLLRRAGLSPWGRRRGRLILRGVFGFLALMCFYFAIVHLPLADATVLQYTNPIFTAILAALFLGERLAPSEIASVLASLVGVLLVARPSFLFGGLSAPPLWEVGIAVAGALCSASAYVTVRSLGTSEDPLVIVFYFPLVTVPLSIPAVVPIWQWPTPWEWAALVGIGVATQIAQVNMTRGLQLERAGRATAISYLQVLFAGAWGMMFFGEIPTLLTVAGAAIIVLSTLQIATRHRRTPVEQRTQPAPG